MIVRILLIQSIVWLIAGCSFPAEGAARDHLARMAAYGVVVDHLEIKDGSNQLVLFMPEEEVVLSLATRSLRIPVYGYHYAVQKGDSVIHRDNGAQGVLVSIIQVAYDDTSSLRFEVGYWGGTILIGSFLVTVEPNAKGIWNVKETIVKIQS